MFDEESIKEIIEIIVAVVIIMVVLLILSFITCCLIPDEYFEEQRILEEKQEHCIHDWQVAGTGKHTVYKVCTECDKYIMIK